MRKKSALHYACLVALLVLSFSARLQAQTVISGSVKTEAGLPVVNASVVVKGRTGGTTTATDGSFTLSVPGGRAVLVITSVGLVPQEISLDGNTTVSVVMEESKAEMDQVVVVGYSSKRKVSLTGSVSNLDTKELSSRPVSQLSQALQGKMAGVTVTQNFGLPGSDNGNIRIRGLTTLGNNSPLVLIDGIEGNLNDINPNDVESLSVLKDAAAAIYGSRAASGVVLITTKRGRLGQPLSVTYNGIFGHQAPTDLPEMVDGATFMVLRNEYQTNANLTPIYSQQQMDEYRQKLGTGNFFNTNWYEVALKRNATQHQHNLTIRGGGNNLSSLVSLSYLQQDALVNHAGIQRFAIRVNTNYQPTRRLGFTMDAFLRKEENNRPNVPGGGSGNGITELFKMMADIPNIYPAVWPDGTYGEGWQGANPLAFIEQGGRSNQLSNRVQLNLGGKLALFDWLSLEGTYAPTYLSGYGKTTTKLFPFRRLDGSMGSYPNSATDLSNSYSRTVENNYRGLLRYHKNFSKHQTSAFVATEYINNTADFFFASRRNFLLPAYEVLDAGSSTPEDRSNGGNGSEWALRSYFGSASYSFDDKYLLQADIRYDGSSRFAPANRWGWFPSVSAGWMISQESFFPRSNTISYLKLRASWGRLGNQLIGNYPYLGTVSLVSPFVFNNNIVTGAQQTILNNPDVTWEKTTTLNGALDFSLFGSKLTGSIDVYKRKTTDILYQRDIPAIIGLTPSEQNIAAVQNIGWDLQLGYRGKHRDFRYQVDVQLSDVRNRVLSLNGKPQYGRNVIFEGEEINAFYGYQSLGIYRSQEELTKYPTRDATVKLGDLILKDLNGDGKINSEDRTIIGSNIPRYTYGATFDFGYKNFDVNIFFQGVGKKDLYYVDNSADYGGNYYTYQLGRYSPNDPATQANPTFPRINGAGANNEDNSFYLYNAAYLRCKNIIVGYGLSQEVLSRLHLKRARVFFSGANLFTIDKLPINTIDPEAPNSSGGPIFYPNVKLYTFGLDIQF